MSSCSSKPVSFRVPGKPLPQPRVKFTSAGPFGRAYTPDRVMGQSLKAYKAAVKQAAIDAGLQPCGCAKAIRIEVAIEPAASLLNSKGRLLPKSRTHPTGSRDGDVDNYSKAVMDGLEVAYVNDSQVVDLTVSKRWALDGPEGCDVEICCLK